MKRLNLFLSLVVFASAFPRGLQAEECPNPKNCSYICHNGWAYDPDEWYLSCDNTNSGTTWQPIGIYCQSSVDEPRSFCNPPQTK